MARAVKCVLRVAFYRCNLFIMQLSARNRRQLIDMVMLTKEEIIQLLPAWATKAGFAVRALHCPQCGASCQRVYLVPWRSMQFCCWKCSKLLQKQPDSALISEAGNPPGDIPIADLVAEHRADVYGLCSPAGAEEQPKKPKKTYYVFTPRGPRKKKAHPGLDAE